MRSYFDDWRNRVNIKRGFFRLALALSTVWVGGCLFVFFNQKHDMTALWIGLGGGTFIWTCYWIIAGFFKGKAEIDDR